MADSFDAINVVYGWLKAGRVKAYKDKAPVSETSDMFAVIVCPVEVNFQVLTSVPININIYHKKNENGMISRSEMKAMKDKINQLIKNGTLPNYLFDLSQRQSYIDTTYSDRYDIMVNRYDITVTAD